MSTGIVRRFAVCRESYVHGSLDGLAVLAAFDTLAAAEAWRIDPANAGVCAGGPETSVEVYRLINGVAVGLAGSSAPPGHQTRPSVRAYEDLVAGVVPPTVFAELSSGDAMEIVYRVVDLLRPTPPSSVALAWLVRERVLAAASDLAYLRNGSAGPARLALHAAYLELSRERHAALVADLGNPDMGRRYRADVELRGLTQTVEALGPQTPNAWAEATMALLRSRLASQVVIACHERTEFFCAAREDRVYAAWQDGILDSTECRDWRGWVAALDDAHAPLDAGWIPTARPALRRAGECTLLQAAERGDLRAFRALGHCCPELAVELAAAPGARAEPA